MNNINHETDVIHALAASPPLLAETEREPRLLLFAEQPVFSLVATQTHEPECRHWCPKSQAIAPADILLGHLRSGWQLDNRVLVEVHRFGSYRQTQLFYFTLSLGSARICMPVLSNPIVLHLVDELGLETAHAHTEPESKQA